MCEPSFQEGCKHYIITFFNKYHQTTTPLACSEDLEEVQKTIATLNNITGYRSGIGMWGQDADGCFHWTEVPPLENVTISDFLAKKKETNKG